MIVAFAAFAVSAALAAVFGVLYFKSKKNAPAQSNNKVDATTEQVSQPAPEEPEEETKEEPKEESEELENKDPNESTDGSDAEWQCEYLEKQWKIE